MTAIIFAYFFSALCATVNIFLLRKTGKFVNYIFTGVFIALTLFCTTILVRGI